MIFVRSSEHALLRLLTTLHDIGYRVKASEPMKERERDSDIYREGGREGGRARERTKEREAAIEKL